MIRVLLAEDQAMVRGALAALLNLEGDIEVVSEVDRGDAVIPAALKTDPDVALLDIEMPGGDGLSAADGLRDRLPGCRVLILTTFGRSGYLRRAMESGGCGFPAKRRPGERACRRYPPGGGRRAGGRSGARRRGALRGGPADVPGTRDPGRFFGWCERRGDLREALPFRRHGPQPLIHGHKEARRP